MHWIGLDWGGLLVLIELVGLAGSVDLIDCIGLIYLIGLIDWVGGWVRGLIHRCVCV